MFSNIHSLRRLILRFPNLKRLALGVLLTAALTYAVRSAGLILSNREHPDVKASAKQSPLAGLNGQLEKHSDAWWNAGIQNSGSAATHAVESVVHPIAPSVVDSQPVPVEPLRLVELFPKKAPKLAAVSLAGDVGGIGKEIPVQISGGLSGTIDEVFLFESESTSGQSGSKPSLTVAPVPEPSTVVLLAVSALGFGLRRRRSA